MIDFAIFPVIFKMEVGLLTIRSALTLAAALGGP